MALHEKWYGIKSYQTQLLKGECVECLSGKELKATCADKCQSRGKSIHMPFQELSFMLECRESDK